MVALDEKWKVLSCSIILMTPLFEKFIVLLQQPGILLVITALSLVNGESQPPQ